MAKLKTHKPYPRTACPHCGGVPRTQKFHDGENICPLCGKTFDAVLFTPPPEVLYIKPALSQLALEGQPAPAAPCARHDLNAAVGNCERCGNFICALCRTPLNGKEYCAACFERLLDEGQPDLPPARERFYAGVANLLALVGMTPGLGLLFGPASIYYGVKGIRQAWRGKMQNVVKFNALFATALGALETLFNWTGVGYILYLVIEKSKW